MTRKADFNAEEWSTVVDGPLYAAMRVISADRGGTLRESLAMGRVYQEARAHHGDSELLDELVTSPPSIDPSRVREAGGNIAELTSQQLRDADGILKAKSTPSELDAYKRFVMTVAQAVARRTRPAAFSASAVSRSATQRTKRWTKSRRRWASPRQTETRLRAASSPTPAVCSRWEWFALESNRAAAALAHHLHDTRRT